MRTPVPLSCWCRIKKIFCYMMGNRLTAAVLAISAITISLGSGEVAVAQIKRDALYPKDLYGNPRYRDSQGNTYTQNGLYPKSLYGGPNLIDQNGKNWSCGQQYCNQQ